MRRLLVFGPARWGPPGMLPGVDPFADGVNLRPALLDAGVTDRELRVLRRTGDITAVRPGAYVGGKITDPVLAHRLAVHAAAAQLGAGTVLSHISAAVLHRLPLWDTPLDRVHITRPRRSGAYKGRSLHLHAATLEPDEITEVDGILVTSVARTLVDLARWLPFEQALVPADAALHRHLLDRSALDEAIERARRRRGNAQARQVLGFARPGAMNPGESRSRLAIRRAGLPEPALQHRLRTAEGTFETDFWWEEFATAGEFDGRIKYGRLLKPGQEPGDVVFAEKCREDAIRDCGIGVVRWIWSEIEPFDAVTRRLRASFGRRR